MGYNGGEFIHAVTLRRFNERFAPHGFNGDAWLTAYGMAELTLCGSLRARGAPISVDRISRLALAQQRRAIPVDAGAEDALEVVSSGHMLPGIAVRIVDEDGAELPERFEGKIQVKTESLFDAYHGDEAATAEVLRDGWLWTGDLGYLAKGELHVCGRSKDLIIKGGENHHPHAFERAVAEVKGVRAGGIAAIGVANPDRGTEDLVIVFETEESTPEALRGLCDEISGELQRRLGVRPDRVVPVAPRAIPKTTSGKVRRRALADSLDAIDKTSRG